jgi:hypothetical protein
MDRGRGGGPVIHKEEQRGEDGQEGDGRGGSGDPLEERLRLGRPFIRGDPGPQSFSKIPRPEDPEGLIDLVLDQAADLFEVPAVRFFIHVPSL